MPEPLKTDPSELAPIESIKTEAKFDPNAALDEAGFLEFLSSYDDSDTFDMKDLPEIENRYNAFKRMKEISAGYKEIAKSKIQEDWDVKMSDADLRSLDVKLQEMAINRPKELEKFEASLKRFKELPSLILARQTELATLGTFSDAQKELHEATLRYNALDVARDEYTLRGRISRGFNLAMGDIELYKDKKHKMSIVTGYFGPMDHQRVEKKSKELDVQINDIKSKLLKIYDAQTDLDALVKEFDPLRKKIYREIGAIEDIAEKIIIKVRNRIDAKIKGDDFGKLIESQGDFVDLQEREKKSELGIQVFGGDDKDPYGILRYSISLLSSNCFLILTRFRL
jgi:hypothetical protein